MDGVTVGMSTTCLPSYSRVTSLTDTTPSWWIDPVALAATCIYLVNS
jgi:hypothetical protein